MTAVITLEGYLGRDPEERYTQSGTKIVEFSVANDIGKDKDANWYYISVFGKQAENCQKYLAKGSRVMVVGELKLNDSNGKVFPNVSAYNVRFLSAKREGQEELPV